MNDIIPPKRRSNQIRPQSNRPSQKSLEPKSTPPLAPAEVATEEFTPFSGFENNQPAPKPDKPKKRRWKKWLLIGIGVMLLLAIATASYGYTWYQNQLQPIAPGSKEMVKITIVAGSGPDEIANLLQEKKLIRSSQAFKWYIRQADVAGKLQSGVYRLSKGSSMASIVDHLTSGKTDTFSITFLPGNTLAKHRQALIKAGYSQDTVDKALAKSYDHPIFASKPSSADLEGYIYGETYQFPADSTVEQILTRTFDEQYKVIKNNDLVAKYKKRGLNLYEAITLASIVQREEKSAEAQKQVAQVFYLRLKKDMPLGSDPTYQYIADKTNVERDPTLNSPYNTRKVAGLPPGPIASPGQSALIAVAEPAKGDYLYFLNGDDEKMYFGRSNEEHENNIRDHCKKKCQIL